MPDRKLKKMSRKHPPYRNRHAEVGCEACADVVRGFRSARFDLEEPQEEPGNYLHGGCSVKYFFIRSS